MVFSFLKNLFSSGSSKQEGEAKKDESVPVLADAPEKGNGERKSRRRRPRREPREGREGASQATESQQESSQQASARPSRSRRSRRPRQESDAAESLQQNPAVPPPSPEEEARILENLKEFVLFVAKGLVNEPEQVSAEIVRKEDLCVIMLSCEKKDTGKLIGKNGKIIASIRILVSGAAGKSGVRATVDIQD